MQRRGPFTAVFLQECMVAWANLHRLGRPNRLTPFSPVPAACPTSSCAASGARAGGCAPRRRPACSPATVRAASGRVRGLRVSLHVWNSIRWNMCEISEFCSSRKMQQQKFHTYSKTRKTPRSPDLYGRVHIHLHVRVGRLTVHTDGLRVRAGGALAPVLRLASRGRCAPVLRRYPLISIHPIPPHFT